MFPLIVLLLLLYYALGRLYRQHMLRKKIWRSCCLRFNCKSFRDPVLVRGTKNILQLKMSPLSSICVLCNPFLYVFTSSYFIMFQGDKSFSESLRVDEKRLNGKEHQKISERSGKGGQSTCWERWNRKIYTSWLLTYCLLLFFDIITNLTA